MKNKPTRITYSNDVTNPLKLIPLEMLVAEVASRCTTGVLYFETKEGTVIAMSQGDYRILHSMGVEIAGVAEEQMKDESPLFNLYFDAMDSHIDGYKSRQAPPATHNPEFDPNPNLNPNLNPDPDPDSYKLNPDPSKQDDDDDDDDSYDAHKDRGKDVY